MLFERAGLKVAIRADVILAEKFFIAGATDNGHSLTTCSQTKIISQ